MRKHDSFRAAVVAALPDLARNPQAFAVFIDKGRVAARAGPAGSAAATGFEWRYALNAVLLDFVGDPNALAKAVLDWIRVAQPEVLLNHASGNEAFQFSVDVLDENKADIEIAIELNEAVDIAPDGTMTYRDEPDLDPAFAGVPSGTLLDAITVSGEALL